MTAKRLIIHHNLDLGDCVVMSGAIRDLKMAFTDGYILDVRTRYPDLWLNNPYIEPIDDHDGEHIQANYPGIQNQQTMSFADAFRYDLEDTLKIKIPWVSNCPDIHLTDEEKSENLIEKEFQYSGKYWVINAGWKADVILKHYPFWQEVCDLLKNDIQIVQIGAGNDHHPPLSGVFNLTGKTSVRELIKVIYRSEGTIGPISAQFVIAAAFQKPSVICAMGKEDYRWQGHSFQRYINVIGCLPCCRMGGCWVAKFEDCKNRVGNIPRCAAMIPPEEVAHNVMLYYKGGIL